LQKPQKDFSVLEWGCALSQSVNLASVLGNYKSSTTKVKENVKAGLILYSAKGCG